MTQPSIRRNCPWFAPASAALAWVVAMPAEALDSSRLCDEAAAIAADRYGVPLQVLQAITRAETGRSNAAGLVPWPWTINEGGAGSWFPTREEAVARAEAAVAAGATNMDIGCFQLNLRWHGAAFASLDAMFDPISNADYAARFLGGLQAEIGDWRTAAGAFHSRTPELADRYLARLDNLLAEPGSPETALALALERVNAFPLLVAGGTGALGSLVPAIAAGEPLFGPDAP